MGQKINPLGFRLGTTQSHHSFWFEKPKNFSTGIREDEIIRNFINDYVKKTHTILSGFEGIYHIGHIVIKKRIDFIQVIISIGFTNIFAEGQIREIEELKINIKKKIKLVNRKLYIIIKRIENPYSQPNIIAEYIALQFKNRVSFRKSIKKAIELTERAGTKGIQVKVSGRIDGKEIARIEWIREGRVPLQTISAKIDHCSHSIRTICGLLGIKIWIY
uniref:Small ribosomal subunit protein uS3c n=1 Tax=Epipogium aphyllum TaxID=449980 RepID=A0A0B4N5R6_9ASPA|nr:ribosomal protein S3 [Epipogium aphyllum]YP_009121278.1 ribosomal protein S3 [Epipogium aphyllum]AII40880.1 ribosomal protein S3 [Epipogium aphyllum]AII40888.1 ribosomal protein S3 [Epipogium aphyllum]